MLLLGVDFWFTLNNVWVRNPGQTPICAPNPYNERGIPSVAHMFSIAVGTVQLIRGNCGHFLCIWSMTVVILRKQRKYSGEKIFILGKERLRTCRFTTCCGRGSVQNQSEHEDLWFCVWLR